MDKKTLTKAVEDLKASKRNFNQSFDLLIALKELNLKNPDEQVEFFMQLPHSTGRKKKICALVGPELAEEAKNTCDKALTLEEFQKMEKKELRKVAKEYDWFIGQADIMPKIAASWGRILGPRGKMPNPKAGRIVPPKASLQPLYERLQDTIKISVKKQPNIQVMIGKQDMDAEQIIENASALHEQVAHHLPKESNNIRSVALKLTMSKPVKL